MGIGLKAIFQARLVRCNRRLLIFRLPSVITTSPSSSCCIQHIHIRKQTYHYTELVYDPSDPAVDKNDFERRNWESSEFCHVEGKEEFPANMSEPRVHGFILRGKVDADHASETVSRISDIFELCSCILVEHEANIS